MNLKLKKMEDKVLAECHQWLFNNFPELRYCCWHVANERKTTKLQGAILKAKGVISGVPDYVVNHNGKTTYIEFKHGKGVLTANQKKLHAQMKKQGFDIHVIRTFEEFKEIIKNILK